MGFFIETLIGGLMAGMLYSLVALGFVLIFKASGVFNFAQGAMVLFAALAMARFSAWANAALGGDSFFLANLIAFVGAGMVMWIVAWVIERLVLRNLVNQEGATLLMATLGITYVLEGIGQTLFGSEIYNIDVGMPKDPVIMFECDRQAGEDAILLREEAGSAPERRGDGGERGHIFSCTVLGEGRFNSKTDDAFRRRLDHSRTHTCWRRQRASSRDG